VGFDSNVAMKGGGIYVQSSSDSAIVMSQVSFNGNTATHGSGVYISDGYMNMSQVSIAENKVTRYLKIVTGKGWNCDLFGWND
jgi:hypothetical protein